MLCATFKPSYTRCSRQEMEFPFFLFLFWTRGRRLLLLHSGALFRWREERERETERERDVLFVPFSIASAMCRIAETIIHALRNTPRGALSVPTPARHTSAQHTLFLLHRIAQNFLFFPFCCFFSPSKKKTNRRECSIQINNLSSRGTSHRS